MDQTPVYGNYGDGMLSWNKGTPGRPGTPGTHAQMHTSERDMEGQETMPAPPADDVGGGALLDGATFASLCALQKIP
jgi:hypothetical protein